MQQMPTTQKSSMNTEHGPWNSIRLMEYTFGHLVKRVTGAIVWKDHDGYVLHSATTNQIFQVGREKKQPIVYLPIRPILLGGDDLTFVCDGRVALDLAATALAQI